MPTFGWDEISGEITPHWNPATGGSDDTWTEQPNDGPVRVFLSDRGHVALQVEAVSAEAAHALFFNERPYRAMQE